MSHTAITEEHATCLVIHLRGEWNVATLEQCFRDIRQEGLLRNKLRVLLDAQALAAPASEMARFFTGELLARELGPPFKVAAIGKPGIVNYFAETVAVNRGAIMKVFLDEDSAITWLTDDGV